MASTRRGQLSRVTVRSALRTRGQVQALLLWLARAALRRASRLGETAPPRSVILMLQRRVAVALRCARVRGRLLVRLPTHWRQASL